MKFSYEMITDVPMDRLWPHYADVKRRFAWEDDLEDMDLDRDFITGTTARMTMTGQPPMPCALVEVGEGRPLPTSRPSPGSVMSTPPMNLRKGTGYADQALCGVGAGRGRGCSGRGQGGCGYPFRCAGLGLRFDRICA